MYVPCITLQHVIIVQEKEHVREVQKLQQLAATASAANHSDIEVPAPCLACMHTSARVFAEVYACDGSCFVQMRASGNFAQIFLRKHLDAPRRTSPLGHGPHQKKQRIIKTSSLARRVAFAHLPEGQTGSTWPELLVPRRVHVRI